MNKNIKILNYLIYLLLLFYLVIDTLTGISLKTIGISFSIPYKLMVMTLMIIVIVNNSENQVVFFSGIFFWLVLSTLFMIMTNYENTFFAIQTYLKLFSNVIFYLYFKILWKNTDFFKDKFSKIILVNTGVFLFNIIIGILGLGYSTYSSGNVGIKGFFFAGNEIFLILLSISTIFMIDWRKKTLLYIFSLVISVLIGTKTAMLSLLIIILVDFYLSMNKKKRLISNICIPLYIFSFIFVYNFILIKLPIFEYINTKFKFILKQSDSILNALLSGRVLLLQKNIEIWKTDFSFSHFLFGYSSFHQNHLNEIDFFDILLLNGSLIAFSILFFYLFLIITAFKKKKYLLCTLDFMILMISFTAGHIWTNLTGGLFFILLNVYALKKEKTKRLKNCIY